MSDCIFCGIGAKEIRAEKIYEDNDTIAVLDVHPRAPGHAIVITKAHRETILDVPENELKPLFSAVKNVVSILSKSLKPDGFTIGINHGKAGGQAVNHLHIHVIPRFINDNGGSIHSVVDNKSSETVQETAARIRKTTN
ncbi:MAG: HIT family protein [Patescibacteria group bacterium]